MLDLLVVNMLKAVKKLFEMPFFFFFLTNSTLSILISITKENPNIIQVYGHQCKANKPAHWILSIMEESIKTLSILMASKVVKDKKLRLTLHLI